MPRKSNVPSNFFDEISILGIDLSRGNLFSLIGSIGGIIAIFLPWISITIPLVGRQGISLLGLSDLINTLSQLSNTFNPGSLPPYVSMFSFYWFILLGLLLVCCYFSINNIDEIGKLAHIGVGVLQIVVLILFYIMYLEILNELKDQMVAYDFGLGLASMVTSLLYIGYGYYVAFLCAILLIIGGIYELNEVE